MTEVTNVMGMAGAAFVTCMAETTNMMDLT